MPDVGHVCEFFYHDEAPRKYGVCVDADDLAFLLINRKRYVKTDIPVDSHEIEWLTQDSYLETGTIQYVYDRDIHAVNGRISTALRDEICAAIEEHGAMAPRFMNPVLTNLRELDDLAP